MRAKVLIAGGLFLAFVVGTMASGIYSATTRVFNPPESNALATERNLQSTPDVARTHFVQPVSTSVQPRTVYVSNSASSSRTIASTHKRSIAREALIVGGSAGAGAAVGAVAGGKKGAGIGALSGGVAGLIYDLATRNK